MNNIYLFATVYLGVLGIVALLFNLTGLNWYWKGVIGLLAVICVVLSIIYQQKEKRLDDLRREHAEFRTESRMGEIKNDLEKLNEKEKHGVLGETDYLNRICLELEKLNIAVMNKGNLVKEQYLTIYFNEVGKIPSFYSWDEWKETEGILFNKMLNELRNHFAARGTFQSGIREALEKEFIKEREKYINAKEREIKAYGK